MKYKLIIAALFGFLIVQTSCDKTSLSSQIDEIRTYLDDMGMLDQAIETDEGVFIVFSNEGTGTETPDINSTINVKYTGRLFDGKDIFDTTNGITQQQNLNQTISGWRISLPYFKVGSVGTVYIPAAHAYGTTTDITGSTGVVIERGSILEFDIELVNFF